MIAWAHTVECGEENARRLGEGTLPSCICGCPEQLDGDAMLRTPERSMRIDKYREMQQLLLAIAQAAPSDNHAAQFQTWAQEILRGMIRPRTPAVRAKDRATELETLVLAYHLASGVFPVESPHLPEARTLITEALKAWERAHPPAALDPALL